MEVLLAVWFIFLFKLWQLSELEELVVTTFFSTEDVSTTGDETQAANLPRSPVLLTYKQLVVVSFNAPMVCNLEKKKIEHTT